ncbi:DNA recombination protein RmuC [Bacteroidales bacterium OttesenSCG-928-M11]|nr:DNA recombination protein RmuC [Bacteroidales bacterium OttesenSCG-928-M11]
MDISSLIIGVFIGIGITMIVFFLFEKKQKEKQSSMQKQMNIEFENIALKILDEKGEKIARINHESIQQILNPLKENINEFKNKVEQTYDKESKERFSLANEVKRLVELNQKISEEANQLTSALKGNSKMQGDWGEMILESILDKSGLVKDREYFIQEMIRDAQGTPIRNQSGQKMQPDVIIKCPDERNIIIDSKVSLSAYVRFMNTDDSLEQKAAMKDHLLSIRKHIDELSLKSYHEYGTTMGYVLMFIPNEPAYLLAMQDDLDLWHYAYNKQVVLISPTNLIATIKLIVDLWRKEYQTRNALEIAGRGAKLYDKLVSFVENLENVGVSLDKAKSAYDDAFKQLSTGNGNLISQAEKLRDMGIAPKKNLKIKN